MQLITLKVLMLSGLLWLSPMGNLRPIDPKLKKAVKSEMSAYGIPCLDVGIADSGCLWVFTTDNGKDRNGLASVLCSTAKSYGVSCVTIVDPKANTLGRSMCR